MSELLRDELYELNKEVLTNAYKPLSFLIKKQKYYSTIPNKDQFLIESFKTKEGFHTIFYPFEGRFVHEALSHLLAYRLSLLSPITFSLAFNDYGFELLSDQYLEVSSIIDNNLFDTNHLNDDLLNGLNLSEMARRKFRDIAVISGLVFSGMPNNRKKK
jgi:ATP-dependent Lhr-like helicase